MEFFLQLSIIDAMSQSPALFIGLIGWAATAKLINDSEHINAWQSWVMFFLTWLLWIVPAFDTTVYHGFLSAEAATLYGGVMTMIMLGILSLLSVRWRRNP